MHAKIQENRHIIKVVTTKMAPAAYPMNLAQSIMSQVASKVGSGDLSPGWVVVVGRGGEVDVGQTEEQIIV